jgi:hypothetical protein
MAHPPATRRLGATGSTDEAVRRRLGDHVDGDRVNGDYVDLEDETAAGGIGCAGEFVCLHLVRR